LTAFLNHWAWAMAETPECANLSAEGMAELGRLAMYINEQLQEAQSVLAAQRRCTQQQEEE
jgi:hypothetical protein